MKKLQLKLADLNPFCSRCRILRASHVPTHNSKFIDSILDSSFVDPLPKLERITS